MARYCLQLMSAEDATAETVVRRARQVSVEVDLDALRGACGRPSTDAIPIAESRFRRRLERFADGLNQLGCDCFVVDRGNLIERGLARLAGEDELGVPAGAADGFVITRIEPSKSAEVEVRGGGPEATDSAGWGDRLRALPGRLVDVLRPLRTPLLGAGLGLVALGLVVGAAVLIHVFAPGAEETMSTAVDQAAPAVAEGDAAPAGSADRAWPWMTWIWYLVLGSIGFVLARVGSTCGRALGTAIPIWLRRPLGSALVAIGALSATAVVVTGFALDPPPDEAAGAGAMAPASDSASDRAAGADSPTDAQAAPIAEGSGPPADEEIAGGSGAAAEASSDAPAVRATSMAAFMRGLPQSETDAPFSSMVAMLVTPGTGPAPVGGSDDDEVLAGPGAEPSEAAPTMAAFVRGLPGPGDPCATVDGDFERLRCRLAYGLATGESGSGEGGTEEGDSGEEADAGEEGAAPSPPSDAGEQTPGPAAGASDQPASASGGSDAPGSGPSPAVDPQDAAAGEGAGTRQVSAPAPDGASAAAPVEDEDGSGGEAPEDSAGTAGAEAVEPGVEATTGAVADDGPKRHRPAPEVTAGAAGFCLGLLVDLVVLVRTRRRDG